MHILIIPSWYPQFSGDIGGSFFREQAIALKRYGHSVGVIYPQIRSLKNIKNIINKPYGLVCQNDEGVNTLRWYAINYLPRVKNFNKNYWIELGLRLFKVYIEKFGNPDIIHVHSMLYAGYVAQIIKQNYKIPYIITEHSSAFARGLIADETIDSLQSVVSDANGCIAVSQKFSDYLNSKFMKSDWVYIPNIVNNDFFVPTNNNLNNKKSKIRIMSVCYLNKNKNIELLIRAFNQVLIQCPNLDFELYIGGDGDEKNNLEFLARQLNLENNIKFLGSLTREQVKQEISRSDIFVVSSKYETFGVVVVEALALGIPVVATKCGGPESIINDNVGILVENNSVVDLAEGIINISTHLGKYSSNYLQQYCLENFSENAIVQKLTKIYIEHSN